MEVKTRKNGGRRPKQVAEVARQLIANAKAAGFPKTRVFVGHVKSEDSYPHTPDLWPPEWRIGDNWEGSTSCLIYRESRWFVRDTRTGEDRDYNYDQALGDAQCWFTG